MSPDLSFLPREGLVWKSLRYIEAISVKQEKNNISAKIKYKMDSSNQELSVQLEGENTVNAINNFKQIQNDPFLQSFSFLKRARKSLRVFSIDAIPSIPEY